MTRATALLATIVVAAALSAGCGNDRAPRGVRKDPATQYVSGIHLVPIAATEEDVDLVRSTLERILPNAEVRVEEPIKPVRFGGVQVDGRAAIEDMTRAYPAAADEPALMLAVTSEDLQDTALAAQIRFAFLVRDPPYAVLSTHRLTTGTDPGLTEDRVAKLLTRVVGSVYFRMQEGRIRRGEEDVGPFGRLDSLADLDAMRFEPCGYDHLLWTEAHDWNTPERYLRELGCPASEQVHQPYEYPGIVATAFEDCRDDGDGDRCYELAELVDREPRIGRFVDRATRIPGATCVDDCVFAVQRASGDRGVVIRSFQAEGRLVAMHTHWPEQGGSFVDSCVPMADLVCVAYEPVCPDARLLAWVLSAGVDGRPRGAIPRAARGPARC